jgi:hypothetical protein
MSNTVTLKKLINIAEAFKADLNRAQDIIKNEYEYKASNILSEAAEKLSNTQISANRILASLCEIEKEQPSELSREECITHLLAGKARVLDIANSHFTGNYFKAKNFILSKLRETFNRIDALEPDQHSSQHRH